MKDKYVHFILFNGGGGGGGGGGGWKKRINRKVNVQSWLIQGKQRREGGKVETLFHAILRNIKSPSRVCAGRGGGGGR